MEPQSKKSILIVDDEPLTALENLQILKKHNYNVYIVHRGEDALEYLQNGYEIELILMDMELGGKENGAELADKLLSIKQIPIIFLTYHEEASYTEKAGRVFNYGYLSKTTNESVFIETVNMALRLSEHRRVIEESERARRNSEHLLAETQKMARIGSWTLDISNDRLYWTDEVYRIFGLEPQEFDATYKAFIDAVHPEDREKVDEAYTNSIRQNQDGYETGHRIVRKNPGEIRDEEGAIVQSIGMVQDVTEYRQKENALHKSERELRHLFQTMIEGFIWTDTEGNIVMANNAAAEMFAYQAPSELMGLHVKDLHEVPEKWDEYRTSLDRGNSIINLDFKGKRRDGTLAWMLVNIQALKTQEGEEIGMELLLRDITDRKELEKLKEEVERISRHDIKSPLNGIIGVPQLLMDEPNITDTQRKYLQMIMDSGRTVLNMIHLSLTIYQIEQGTYKYSQEYFDLLQTMRQCMGNCQTLASYKNLKILTSTNGFEEVNPEKITVAGEELLAYSVVSNLVKNAVEASPKQEVVQIDITNAESNILFSVHNKGVVPKRIRNTFFNKYTTSGKKGGTGIGTYSAKILSEAQGWSIDMETSEEKGTKVTVTIPSVNRLR